MPKLVILGAGSHARVVLDCLRVLGRGDDILGMIEVDGDRARWGRRLDGCLVLGGLDRLRLARRVGVTRLKVAHERRCGGIH